MRLYLAGPMAGLPHHNFPAFHAEASRLRGLGHDVVNPAEINVDFESAGREVCMRRDLQALMTCEALALLPGWERSKGAQCEFAVAVQLGMMAVGSDCFCVPVTARAPERLAFDPSRMVALDDCFNGRKTIVDLTAAAIQADGAMRENAITAKLVEMGWTQPGQARAPLTRAMEDLVDERVRQQTAENWSTEHDDEHREGELCYAAAGYATAASSALQAIEHELDADGEPTLDDPATLPHGAPWPHGWTFKPAPPRRQLVKSGALILAEIERIDRMAEVEVAR